MPPLPPIALAAAGALAIAIGAQVSVPMVPVPMTLQTWAVAAVALVGGARVGTGAALLYLALCLAGLPVLAGGSAHGGLSFFDQPTAGYVVGFVPAAAATGWVGRRGGRARARLAWGVLAGLAGHAVVLTLGVAALTPMIGFQGALLHGGLPFLPGALAKSVAAAGFALAVRARLPVRDDSR